MPRKPRPDVPKHPGPIAVSAAFMALTAAAVALAATALVPTRAFAASGGPPAEIKAAEAAAFAEADANGDGYLDATELASFHEIMRSKLDALHFSRLDADGDGLVSLAELKAGRPSEPACGGGHGGGAEFDVPVP